MLLMVSAWEGPLSQEDAWSLPGHCSDVPLGSSEGSPGSFQLNLEMNFGAQGLLP